MGDKVGQGDGRTPEGRFVVCRRVDPSAFHRAFLLNYPTEEHALRGLLDGLIGREEYEPHLARPRSRPAAAASTALGGLIEILGYGVGYDWTEGCVAMRDRDIDELWPVVRVGTPVRIDP